MSDITFDAVFPVHKVKALSERNGEYYGELSLSITSVLSMNSDELREFAQEDISGALNMLEFHAEAKRRLEEAIELNRAVYARLLSVLSEWIEPDSHEK